MHQKQQSKKFPGEFPLSQLPSLFTFTCFQTEPLEERNRVGSARSDPNRLEVVLRSGSGILFPNERLCFAVRCFDSGDASGAEPEVCRARGADRPGTGLHHQSGFAVRSEALLLCGSARRLSDHPAACSPGEGRPADVSGAGSGRHPKAVLPIGPIAPAAAGAGQREIVARSRGEEVRSVGG